MSNLDITIDWHKPSRTTIMMHGKPTTFAQSRLYDLIDGLLNEAEKTGEAEVWIHLALVPEIGTQTGTETGLSAKSEDA